MYTLLCILCTLSAEVHCQATPSSNETQLKDEGGHCQSHASESSTASVEQDIAVPAPLLVEYLKSHHLGVGVASAHSSTL